MPYGIGGSLPGWNSDDTTNRLKQSYVKDFIDISGSLVLRNNANLYVHGNTTVNGKLLLNATNLQADLSFNRRILVGTDMSMNGNVTIASDVSLNGVVTGCILNANSIPTSAFKDTVTSGGPDYTKASVIYQQKFRANGDVSMNGSTVQATNMTVNGNIEFNDGTTMTTYDDNKTVSLTGSTYDSSLNNTTYLAPLRWMAGSEGGKYLYMVTGSYFNSWSGGNVNPYGAYNAITNTGAFYRSSDYGANWTKITIPGSNDYYTGGVDSSTTGQYVIVGTHVWPTGTNLDQTTNQDKFFVSNDYGVSWTGFNMNTTPEGNNTNERLAGVSMSATGQYMSVMPYNNTSVYQLYSIDYGVSWTKKLSGFGEFNFILDATLFLMSADGRYLYGGKTGMNRIDISNNSGLNMLTTFRDWTPNWSACSKKSTLMAFSLTNAASTAEGDIYVCADGVTVATKNVSTTNLHQSKRVYIDYNDYIYVTINNKCYVSIDTGNAWTEVTFSPTIPSNITINYIYVTPKYIFTGEGTLQFSGNGTYTPNAAVYKKYIRQTLFKASTFTGLTIKNALTASSYVVSSDYRIKTNVAKLDNTFNVDNLRPVKYMQTLLNKEQYGLIAHELQQYYPDLVIGEKDGPDLQRVNYTGLIAILINEINQLKRVVAEQEKKRQSVQSTQNI
jgi:hypothetical protein